jgi:hypothetical protein
MKAKTRRTEINIETHQVTVIRFRNERLTGFCRECGRQVPVLAVEKDINAPCLGITEVKRVIDAADIHLIGTADGGTN